VRSRVRSRSTWLPGRLGPLEDVGRGVEDRNANQN
jgi:hypothetical protein